MAVVLVICTSLTATDAKHILRINEGHILEESEVLCRDVICQLAFYTETADFIGKYQYY